MGQTLDDKDGMGFDIVICAAAGTDDLGSHARKALVQNAARSERRKFALEGVLRNRSRRHIHGSVKILSAVQAMSKLWRRSQVAGRS